MEKFPIGQRIDGAMRMAGFHSAEEAAAAWDAKGFSAGTLRRIVDGKRELRAGELQAIADFLEVPLEFLTIDIELLPELAQLQHREQEREDRLDRIEAENEAILAALDRIMHGPPPDAREERRREQRAVGQGFSFRPSIGGFRHVATVN